MNTENSPNTSTAPQTTTARRELFGWWGSMSWTILMILNDPVCNEQMGMREGIQKAFAACGEDYWVAYTKIFRKITGVTPTEFRK